MHPVCLPGSQSSEDRQASIQITLSEGELESTMRNFSVLKDIAGWAEGDSFPPGG